MDVTPRLGILLAAHGERRENASNAGVAALAAELGRRGVAAEVRFGFINGAPTIAEAIHGFSARDILVHPLFLSDGYFARVRLPRLIGEAQFLFPSRSVRIQPALGLNSALPQVIAGRAIATSRSRGLAARETTVVLLAHGSPTDAASRRSTENIALRVQALHPFAGVACAFLDEAPTLVECVSTIVTPIVVIGLFIGDGLHGNGDVSELMSMLDIDISFGGNIGEWPEIADIVAASVCEPLLN